MICDFHSHALFAIDDGAKDKAMSIQMLRQSAEQGVDTVLLTPHCYPNSSADIEELLAKRDIVCNEICNTEGIPELKLGCEVHMTQDLTHFRNIKKLCIENTNYMLLEMPRTLWTDETIDDVYKLTLTGIIPIIAHDERNAHQSEILHNALYDLNVLIQVNAQTFISSSSKKTVDNMLKLGLVHVIGTDMHNVTSRKPCMEQARKKIIKRYGNDCWEYLMGNAERILNGEIISYHDFKSFKKKGLF